MKTVGVQAYQLQSFLADQYSDLNKLIVALRLSQRRLSQVLPPNAWQIQKTQRDVPANYHVR